TIAVAEVKITAIEAHQKVDNLARKTKHREKELEHKLAAEQAERERVGKENQKRNQELAEQLEALRPEKFKKEAADEQAKKLLKFAELKEEKQNLTRKLFF
ncbi:10294_t:CDS:1, partial [Paraglomus occultum]